MLKKQFLLSAFTLSAGLTLANTDAQFRSAHPLLADEAQFRLKHSLLEGATPVSLDQAQEHIAKHERRRIMDNWIFTDPSVCKATIAALNCYKTLSPDNQVKHQEALQDILSSHGNYLYHLLYWNEVKHAQLVDGFMNDAAGRRLPQTLLDAHRNRMNFFTGIVGTFDLFEAWDRFKAMRNNKAVAAPGRTQAGPTRGRVRSGGGFKRK